MLIIDYLRYFPYFSDVGARNHRHICVVNYNKAPGFEVIQGLLDRIMQLVEVPYSKTGPGYYLKEAQGINILQAYYFMSPY